MRFRLGELKQSHVTVHSSGRETGEGESRAVGGECGGGGAAMAANQTERIIQSD